MDTLVGKRIRDFRKSANLTQKQLGEKIGVSGAMIGQYETGVRNPKRETLERIADALGVHVFDFDVAAYHFVTESEAYPERETWGEMFKDVSDYITGMVATDDIRSAIITLIDNCLNDTGRRELLKKAFELSLRYSKKKEDPLK